MRNARMLAAVLGLLVAGTTMAAWELKPGKSPVGGTCTLESAFSMPDGYQTAKMVVGINEQGLYLRSEAPFDASFHDLTLAVDNNASESISKLQGPKLALLNGGGPERMQAFIKGLTLRLGLRFWPTWPAKGVQHATVSLIGFHLASQGLANCRESAGRKQP